LALKKSCENYFHVSLPIHTSCHIWFLEDLKKKKHINFSKSVSSERVQLFFPKMGVLKFVQLRSSSNNLTAFLFISNFSDSKLLMCFSNISFRNINILGLIITQQLEARPQIEPNWLSKPIN
jgi:hypothetical protein